MNVYDVALSNEFTITRGYMLVFSTWFDLNVWLLSCLLLTCTDVQQVNIFSLVLPLRAESWECIHHVWLTILAIYLHLFALGTQKCFVTMALCRKFFSKMCPFARFRVRWDQMLNSGHCILYVSLDEVEWKILSNFELRSLFTVVGIHFSTLELTTSHKKCWNG